MARKKKKTKLNPLSGNRQDAVDQGFYDGRFRRRVVPDKKKKENKKKAKVKIIIDENT
ncbi:MAG: hypothetical protein ABIP51_18085 [Bacteroidia bacterium]